VPTVSVHLQDHLCFDIGVVHACDESTVSVVDRELRGWFRQAGRPQEEENPVLEHAVWRMDDARGDEALPEPGRSPAASLRSSCQLDIERVQLLRRDRLRCDEVADELLELMPADETCGVLQGPNWAGHRDATTQPPLARGQSPRPMNPHASLRRLVPPEQRHDVQVPSMSTRRADLIPVEPHRRDRARNGIRSGEAGGESRLLERRRGRAPSVDTATNPLDEARSTEAR
jgi:hypothetical protein